MNEMLVFLYQSITGSNSVLKMIGLILLCVLIIVASYYTTKFVGKKQMGRTVSNGNFEPLETFRLANDKYLQLIRIGNRYFVIAVGKTEVSVITELSEEDITFKKVTEGNVSFKQVLSGIAKRGKAPKSSEEIINSEPEMSLETAEQTDEETDSSSDQQ